MSNAMMQRRIRDILLHQVAMGSGTRRCARGTKKRCVRKRRVGSGYGTSLGAYKGWEHKYKRALGRGGAKKRTSPWIAHVKRYAREHGIGYGEALIRAKASYRGSGVLVGGTRRRRVSSRSRTSGSKTVRKRAPKRKSSISALIKRLM